MIQVRKTASYEVAEQTLKNFLSIFWLAHHTPTEEEIFGFLSRACEMHVSFGKIIRILTQIHLNFVQYTSQN